MIFDVGADRAPTSLMRPLAGPASYLGREGGLDRVTLARG